MGNNQQLELFCNGPFTVRWRFTEAMNFFWENYWKDKPKGKTTRKACTRLQKFFESKYIDEISKISVEELRKHLSDLGLKANTVNTHHMILVRFFNQIAEWKEIKVFNGLDFTQIQVPIKNPASLVPKVNEAQFARNIAWPKRTVLKLVATAQRLNDQVMADAIDILYATRLRPGDLLRMTDKNVDLVRLILSGIQHKTITKKTPSGVPYLLALTKRTARILKRRINAVPSGTFLFPLNDREMQRRFDLIRKVAGLPFVQRRDMRPSSATLLLDNGIDPRTVQESLGQTTLRMLPNYTPRKIIHQREAQRIQEDGKTEILI